MNAVRLSGFPRWLLLGLGLALLPGAMAATSPLAPLLNPRDSDYEFARPTVDANSAGTPLSIGGRTFAHGLGIQADNRTAVRLNGSTRFLAWVGVDDASVATEPVLIEVRVDGDIRWRHGMSRGDPAAEVDIELRGGKVLELTACDMGNRCTRAMVDWAEARLVVTGEPPVSMVAPALAEPAVILTPPPPAAPRINGPAVFGARPGHPFLYAIPATGERPMRFGADGLPDGLALDAATGRITGRIARPGTYAVTLRAANARGKAARVWHIVAGETIALTPAMGWNSWNCWGVSVDQAKVLASARALVASGLANHGWTYVNIDDSWQGRRSGPGHALQPNAKFPDLKQLCDELHAMGLKAGIYSTPWITSYAGYAGGSADNPAGDWTKPSGPKQPNRRIKPWHLGDYSFAAVDARQWAEWGIDYLKYDWNPNEPPETRAMAAALRACGRDIVYSLSNNAPPAHAAALSALANSWRTTGDIRDVWGSVRGIWARQEAWRGFARPGHWNDPDMLVVGPVDVGRGRSIRPSRLTPNEQYTHITLWCLLSAPLLIGCPVERADAFTLGLLSNDEVLAVDQDPLGRPARPQQVDGRKMVYVKELADGSHAVGFFNLAQTAQIITVNWSRLGLARPSRARDLWRQRDVPLQGDNFSVKVGRHGTSLLQIRP
jgi:alpha-galactosidase